MHTMRPGSNHQTTFRRPTAHEQAYIASRWTTQLNRHYRANRGKVVIGFAIAGLILLVLDILVAPATLSDKLVLTAGVCCCLSAGIKLRRHVRRIENMIAMLNQGRFCVLSAVAEGVRYNTGSRIYNGYVRVSLDGGRTYGEYQFPVEDTERKQRENVNVFPVLLVKLESEQEIVAVAAP